LIFVPGFYIPFLLNKFGLYPIRTNVATELFWGKRIGLDLGKDPDAYALHRLGCLRGQEVKLIKSLIKNLKEDNIFYNISSRYVFIFI
jgi:hypothetical protein